jgi:hypothetical protein
MRTLFTCVMFLAICALMTVASAGRSGPGHGGEDGARPSEAALDRHGNGVPTPTATQSPTQTPTETPTPPPT